MEGRAGGVQAPVWHPPDAHSELFPEPVDDLGLRPAGNAERHDGHVRDGCRRRQDLNAGQAGDARREALGQPKRPGPDKFESESRAFFERTRAEYLRRAGQSPQRFRVIDATQSIEAIRVELEGIISIL